MVLMLSYRLYNIIDQKPRMLSQELIDIFNEVKRTQMNSGCRLMPFAKSENQQLYTDISCNLLNVCDWFDDQQVKIQKTTKFLAKSYCDQYLDYLRRSNVSFDPQKEDLLVYSSIRIAIKFNELSEISDLYSIDFFIKISQTDFKQVDFVNFQVQQLIALSYRLKISTPYDLLPLNQLLSPLISSKQLKKIIPIINFSLSIQEFAKLSASEIFFSCFLVQAHKILERCQFELFCNIVQAIIGSEESWDMIKRSAEVLRLNINAFFNFSQQSLA